MREGVFVCVCEREGVHCVCACESEGVCCVCVCKSVGVRCVCVCEIEVCAVCVFVKVRV